MAIKKTCPKCQGLMSEGCLISCKDGTTMLTHWLDGAPVKSWFGGIKTRGKTKYPVVTHRCSRCGFLEHFAPEA